MATITLKRDIVYTMANAQGTRARPILNMEINRTVQVSVK